MNFNRISSRIALLRQKMSEYGTDSFLMTVNEGFNWENIFYISGFRGSSCSILITSENEYIITDGRYLEQAKAETPFTLVDQGKRSMSKAVMDLISELSLRCAGFEADRMFTAFYRKMEDLNLEWCDLSGVVPSLRRTKDPEEISLVKKAADIAAQAFKKTIEETYAGMEEVKFANLLEFNVRDSGAECGWPGHGFVVVSGSRTSLPHGVPTQKKIGKGDWVTVDFGATYNGYISDITRNFVIGEPDNKSVELHQIVLEAHLAAAEALKPGMECRRIDAIARDLITSKKYGENFNHGLGHGIGLEVHEKPRLSHSSEDILKPGDIVTVEPGIYIQDLGGVRIEDDYLITENGAVRLTDSLSREFLTL